MRRRNKLPRSLAYLVLAAAGLIAGHYGLDRSGPPSQDAGRKRGTPQEQVEVKLHIDKCHDGDTCTARSPEGFKMTLRLVGIDAPEVAKTRGPKKKRNSGQSYGAQARDYLNQRVSGKTLPVQIVGNDPYNRYLAILWDDSKANRVNINQQMVAEGYAFAYSGRAETAEIQDWAEKAQSQAKAQKRGLWGIDTPPQDPSEFRKSNR